jgi:hypothetical protein
VSPLIWDGGVQVPQGGDDVTVAHDVSLGAPTASLNSLTGRSGRDVGDLRLFCRGIRDRGDLRGAR